MAVNSTAPLELPMFAKPINRLLNTLSEHEYERLLSYLTPVYLKAGKTIWQPFEPITMVYFPNNALISLVSHLENGVTTEIALIGYEGVVGLPVILGTQYCPYEAIVQIEGVALRLDAKIFKEEFKREGSLFHRLLAYSQARLTQSAQTSVCNRQHTIEARLARWLLSVRDCTLCNELPVTQELIANMLGVRRSGVTVALGKLQKLDIIRCYRGKIVIIDAVKLTNVSCECYALIKDEFARLLKLANAFN